jgi:hypothetical protein
MFLDDEKNIIAALNTLSAEPEGKAIATLVGAFWLQMRRAADALDKLAAIEEQRERRHAEECG